MKWSSFRTRIESFLLLRPFRRLPLGSFESEVRGFPFFRGSLTMKIEKARFPAPQITIKKKPAKKQLRIVEKLIGLYGGRMLAFESVG